MAGGQADGFAAEVAWTFSRASPAQIGVIATAVTVGRTRDARVRMTVRRGTDPGPLLGPPVWAHARDWSRQATNRASLTFNRTSRLPALGWTL